MSMKLSRIQKEVVQLLRKNLVNSSKDIRTKRMIL